MPNRIIREGWVESDAINALSAPEEVFFLRVCLRADDFGRYNANPVLLKSNLFPLKEDLRNTDIPRWLAACEKAGLVRCYEVSGKKYLQINKFNQRTRAEKSKFPEPPAVCQSDVSQVTDICQPSDGPPRTYSETETETETTSSSPPGDGVAVVTEFDKFWTAYPRKVGKGAARSKFEKAIKKTALGTMLAAIEVQKRSDQWTKDGGQFIPHPETWLHQERWADGGTEIVAPLEASPSQPEGLKVFRALNNTYHADGPGPKRFEFPSQETFESALEGFERWKAKLR